MTTTQTLELADADIVYDVDGPLPTADGRPPLFMIGQPMTAVGFGALASHFPDRTVVTYDPRGLGRSTRRDGRSDHSPAVQADDSAGPAEVLAQEPFESLLKVLLTHGPTPIRWNSRVSGASQSHQHFALAQDAAFAQHARALQRVSQLANISRPWGVQEQALGAGAHAADRLSKARRELLHEGRGEVRDVLATFAQRRQQDLDDVQAIVEVLAESSDADLLEQVSIRGGDHAHFDVPGLG